LADNLLSSAPYAWHFTAADVTPPQVLAVSPTNGAICVPWSAPVRITFSETISTSTFAYAIMPDPGGWAETWNVTENVVTLPHTNFYSQTTYNLTVTIAADLAGNPLSGTPYVWHFTTRPCQVYLPVVMRNY
jgi:hypothetical protein